MNPESFHHPETSGDCTIRHDPENHVSRFGHQGYEIPKRIMSGSCSRNFVVRFRLHSMNQIGKLNVILKKENWNIIADKIENTFLCVKLHSESANMTRHIGRAARSDNSRKAHENGSFFCRILKESRLR